MILINNNITTTAGGGTPEPTNEFSYQLNSVTYDRDQLNKVVLNFKVKNYPEDAYLSMLIHVYEMDDNGFPTVWKDFSFAQGVKLLSDDFVFNITDNDFRRVALRDERVDWMKLHKIEISNIRLEPIG